MAYSPSPRNDTFNLRITYRPAASGSATAGCQSGQRLLQSCPTVFPTVSTPIHFYSLIGITSKNCKLKIRFFSLNRGNLDQLGGAERLKNKSISCKQHLCRMTCFRAVCFSNFQWLSDSNTFHTVFWPSRKLSGSSD